MEPLPEGRGSVLVVRRGVIGSVMALLPSRVRGFAGAGEPADALAVGNGEACAVC